MTTWCLTQAKEALHAVEAPDVALAPGQVRLAVEAVTLGQLDWGLWCLDAPPVMPAVMGTEVVGVVCESTVAQWPVGRRAGLSPLRSSCTACPLCERGLERYCTQAKIRGRDGGGGLTQRLVISASELLEVPALEPTVLAPLLGSGWSALGALRAGGVGAGTRIAVFGIGGMGHLVLQLASFLFGDKAVGLAAVDPSPAARALAKSLGAVHVLEPEDSARVLQKDWNGVDAALVCTPSIQAISAAVRSLRPDGTLVLAGSSPYGRVDLPLEPMVSRGLTVRGSFLGTRMDLLDVLRLGAEGKLKPTVQTGPMSDAANQLWNVRDGAVVGRLVLTA